MQINRLFEIIYILLEKKKVTSSELAKHFEVSSRTIYRDIETLSQAGIPVYMSKGKGGGISLLPDFILNKAVLTEQEKADIMSALKAVNAVNFTHDDSVFKKMDSMLGNSSSDWIEVYFSNWGNSQNEAENFKLLKNAVLEKNIITFMYASGKYEKTIRKVFPLKLVFKGAAWYLYGFCTVREDYRFFKLRRIDSLVIADEKFTMSAPEIIFPEWKADKHKFIKTKFEISEKMAFRIYDEFNDFELLDNGNFLCEIMLPDINTICTYAASFGEYCKIIEPVEAYNELKNKIKKMLEIYS